MRDDETVTFYGATSSLEDNAWTTRIAEPSGEGVSRWHGDDDARRAVHDDQAQLLLGAKAGSVDFLKVRMRCGWRRCAAQIPGTARSEELCENLSDGCVRKAAYRGGW
jgi:hypothetical protein